MGYNSFARRSHETAMRARKLLVVGKINGICRVAHRTRRSNTLHLRDGCH